MGIYVLRNTLKVLPHTRGDIFQITVPHNDEKTWWKCSDGDFTSNWDSFTCWLSIRAPNRRFLQRGLSKFFTVCNFGKSLAMSIIFFSKCLKFDLDSKNRKKKKNSEKLFCFSDNCIWIGNCKFSQSSTKYFPSTAYVLTNTLKTLHNTLGNIFKINVPQNDEKHDKSALMEISQVLGTPSHVDCQGVFPNGTFYTVVWRTFSQSVILEIQ